MQNKIASALALLGEKSFALWANKGGIALGFSGYSPKPGGWFASFDFAVPFSGGKYFGFSASCGEPVKWKVGNYSKLP